jgi:hypothetical protein
MKLNSVKKLYIVGLVFFLIRYGMSTITNN